VIKYHNKEVMDFTLSHIMILNKFGILKLSH